MAAPCIVSAPLVGDDHIKIYSLLCSEMYILTQTGSESYVRVDSA